MKKSYVQSALPQVATSSISGVMNMDDKIKMGINGEERSVRDVLAHLPHPWYYYQETTTTTQLTNTQLHHL